ncbi:MAG: four helix bundle protein [Gemmatimonadaceae bacterium]
MRWREGKGWRQERVWRVGCGVSEGLERQKPLRNYRDLRVWQAAMDLVIEVYSLARQLPRSEVYGLASQLQRAAVSVPTNIAEGYGRESRREYLRYLSIANGSLKELETLLLVVQRANLVSVGRADSTCVLADRVGGLLTALRRSLKPRKTSVPSVLEVPDTPHPTPHTLR